MRRAVEEDELALDVPADATDQAIEEATTTARRNQGRKTSEKARQSRREALEKLLLVREVVYVKPEQLPAGMTLDDFRPPGAPEIVRHIEHVREHLVLVDYHLEKLVKKGGEHIVSAQSPPSVIEGGAWGASVYAPIIVQQCIDSIPLYRQENAGAWVDAREGTVRPKSPLGQALTYATKQRKTM